MKFGIFYEHQLPRPWDEGGEQRLFQDALDQVELADRLGIDYAWEVEHHFLEEYSHSSAPEVFLAACCQRTKQHPPRPRHRADAAGLQPSGARRRAHRHARPGLRTAASSAAPASRSSRIELEGFGIDYRQKRDAMWREAVEQVANMMAMDPYPGFQGKYFSMPARNVVPKPVQKPHPPLWVACSNRETIHLAAQLGIGALTFAFVDPGGGEALGRRLLRDLQERVRADRPRREPEHRDGDRLLVPRGREEARARGARRLPVLPLRAGHYYIFGKHKPGRTEHLGRRSRRRAPVPGAAPTGGIGTPDELRAHLRDVRGRGRRPGRSSSSRAATTATSTSASRSSCSPTA